MIESVYALRRFTVMMQFSDECESEVTGLFRGPTEALQHAMNQLIKPADVSITSLVIAAGKVQA